MSKYYKLYLNNNDGKNYDYELEEVVLKTRKVIHVKKTLFGKKDVITDEEFLDSTIVIGEKVNGVMYDIVSGKKIESFKKQIKTELGFTLYKEESNSDYPFLSYYNKEELSNSEVACILKQYSPNDIKRYVEKLNSIEELSLNNYNKEQENHKKQIQDEIESEEFTKDFKKRFR